MALDAQITFGIAAQEECIRRTVRIVAGKTRERLLRFRVLHSVAEGVREVRVKLMAAQSGLRHVAREEWLRRSTMGQVAIRARSARRGRRMRSASRRARGDGLVAADA